MIVVHNNITPRRDRLSKNATLSRILQYAAAHTCPCTYMFKRCDVETGMQPIQFPIIIDKRGGLIHSKRSTRQ